MRRDYLARYGNEVRSGSFRGMKYITRSGGSTFLPKLIGSYECELHPATPWNLKGEQNTVQLAVKRVLPNFQGLAAISRPNNPGQDRPLWVRS